MTYQEIKAQHEADDSWLNSTNPPNSPPWAHYQTFNEILKREAIALRLLDACVPWLVKYMTKQRTSDEYTEFEALLNQLEGK